MKLLDYKDEQGNSSRGANHQSRANQAQAHAQLKIMLANPLFQSGSRSGSMLQYVVERTLEGKSLKGVAGALSIEMGVHPGVPIGLDLGRMSYVFLSTGRREIAPPLPNSPTKNNLSLP